MSFTRILGRVNTKVQYCKKMSDTKQWNTKILKPEQMDEAVQCIREGNVVAFPTGIKTLLKKK